MLPFAHLSSGYLVYASVAHTVALDSLPLLSASLAGAMAPDIDGLFGAQMKDHRNTVFHAPLFWFSLCITVFILGSMFAPASNIFILVFFLSVFVHLLLDWFSARTSGIRILYPFSKKNYACFPLQPERGAIPLLPGKQYFKTWVEFWKFYFSKKFLVTIEVLVTISPIVVYALFKK